MRLDTTSAGSLAEGGLSQASAALGRQATDPSPGPPPGPAHPPSAPAPARVPAPAATPVPARVPAPAATPVPARVPAPAAAPVPVGTDRRTARAWARRVLHSAAAPFAALAVVVLGFSGGWPGALALDGPGVSMYVRLALDHVHQVGSVSYWMPELWAGSPAWALAPSFPVLSLVPAAVFLGADGSVKLAILASQVLGGWGAYVLARSLWGDRKLLPLAAAVFYSLHPLFLSHGALFGDQTSVSVMAITPWLAWSVRKAFQGGGRRYAVVAGLLAALAVLEQAEHAYGLAVLCLLQLCIELARARRGEGAAVRHVLSQAATVVAVAFGAIAFWLLPFLALHEWFVLSPPEMVRTVLVDGMASVLGREPGTFLTRAHALRGAVTFDGDLLSGNFYLSWALVVPAFVTAALLSRRDDDGHLTAILLAGGVGTWLSTAGVRLADSGPAQRGNFVPFLAIGGITGVLVGSFLRRLVRGRAAALSGAAAVLLLLGVPYFTPFLTLQRVIPLLASIRFPRFYPVAALSIALGAAFALRIVFEWASEHWPARAVAVTAASSVALVLAFLVDVAPYRSFYRVRPPADRAAYEQAAEALRAVGRDFRVATSQFGDARLIDSLLAAGSDLSVGWPHPIAGRDLWRLTGETIITPSGYREAALALSSTAYVAAEQVADLGRPSERVTGVQLERNPRALPLVRTYRSAVVVRDRSVAPELAVSLAPRGVAVVSGGADQSKALATLGRSALQAVDSADACGDRAPPSGGVGHEVAMACGLHRWIGVLASFEFPAVAGDVGAVFLSPADGLEGVSVWLDRPPLGTEIALRQLLPDGRLGPEVARAAAAGLLPDENGLYAFRFPALERSAAGHYAFLLSCARCAPGDEPRMVVTTAPRGAGNLVRAGQLKSNRAAAFTPLYAHLPPTPAPASTVHAQRRGPGRWQVDVSGSESALVVVSDAYFPGWQAKVDGRRVEVLQADAAFLGVPVGPGEHRIELTYGVPAATVAGRVVTGVTFAALLVAVPVSRRRVAVHPPEGQAEAAGAGGPIPSNGHVGVPQP